MCEPEENEDVVCPVCGCPELGGCTHWIALLDWTFKFIDDCAPLNEYAFNFAEQLQSEDLKEKWREFYSGNNLEMIRTALLLAGAQELIWTSYGPPGCSSLESIFFSKDMDKTAHATIKMLALHI